MKRGFFFTVGLTLLALAACNLPSPTRLASISPTVTAIPASPLNTPTTAPLQAIASPQIVDIHMLDVNNGWAVGESSVMRTDDAGTTWKDVTPPGVTMVGSSAGYFFMDAGNAWLVVPGSDPTSGMLYHTTDGGHSWSSGSIPFGGASLQFSDATNGWALVGLGGGMSHQAVAVFRTTDGGSSWNQVFTDDPGASGSTDTLPFVGDKNGIVALDQKRAVVTGSQPSSDFIYFYISQDGGTTWSQPSFTMPPDYAGAMTNASLPRFFGNNGILPVGLYANTPGTVFYLSADGGLTWTPSKPVVLNGKYSIASATDLFVWDGGPSLFVSHDAGSTWSSIAPNISIADTLMTFQFVNATTGWAVTGDASSHYSLYKTVDGGKTWSPQIP